MPGGTGKSDLATSLVALGSASLARGEIDSAEERFARAMANQPGSIDARIGLARVAQIRGESQQRRLLLEEALALDGSSADALIAMASLEKEAGSPERSRSLLERALQEKPPRADAHAALAALTGTAPRGSVVSAAEAGLRANAYPYDPWAGLQAARAFLALGRRDLARGWLYSSYWLADLDPESGLAAARLLKQIDEQWSTSRIVPVHCYADQSLHSDPAWRMRLRLLWSGTTAALAPLVDTVFVPVSMSTFSSAGVGDGLVDITAAAAAELEVAPETGILAVFSQRFPKRRSGKWRLGQAEFLGRRITLRLEPGSIASRTLLHEVLHLYGGVHAAGEFESLMNPHGDSMSLDPANARIAQLLRGRRFGAAGLAKNVLSRVDPRVLTAAYAAALRLNLDARRSGMLEALEARTKSRARAAKAAREAVELDSHLGDVSRFVARLLIRQKRFGKAARLLESASRLYGPRTRRGREAKSRAESLRRIGGSQPERSGPE